MSELNLKDKVVVITGAGGVICGEIARALGKTGAKLALLNRTVEKAQKIADEINAAGGIAKAYVVNVVDKESLKTAHEQVLSDFGKCDILINGAGGNNPSATTSNETAIPGETYEKDF